MAFRLSLTLTLVLGFAATVAGQRVITVNQVQLIGSVVQITFGNIAIKAANGRNWTVHFDGNTRIKVSGTAEPEMLMPGICVRFTAQIDKRTAKPRDKIDKITIFTPTPGMSERTLGVERAGEHPPGSEDENNAAALPVIPAPGRAADPGITEEGAAGKTPKRHGSGEKGTDKSAPDVAAYDVCAQVVSAHGRRLVLSVQNRFFKSRFGVELSADAQIGLDLGNLSTVKPGDKISASGYYMTAGICEANSVEVALAKPLAPPGSHPHHARPATHGSDASRRPEGKAKPGGEAAAGKNAAAKEPAEGEVAPKNPPPENNGPPAKSEPETEPEAPPPIDLVPPAEDAKPDEKPEK